ncbi:MAG TPA: SMI1/KNR4 family protein [Bacteroidales bacterium]
MKFPSNTTIEQLIKALKDGISSGKINAYFGSPADSHKIQLFETAFGVKLPGSYKTFLTHFNGGFIADSEADNLILIDEFEEAKNISTRILSIEELIESYESLSIDNWKIRQSWEGFYPYLPFCIKSENEKLIFIDQTMPNESSVYFALHDEPARDWEIVFDGFTDFLANYILSNGQPEYSVKSEILKAEDLLVTLEAKFDEKNDPEAIVKRNSAYLELFPNDALSYTLRGNAYFDLHQYENALNDFNKSIEINPKSAFAYHNRGKMLLSLEKSRAALIDMDTACRLKPGDPYYLVGRADAFYALNRMEEALADCNRAIELDEYEILAYMTRYKIYLYQGEGYKAEADNDKIDELLADE